MAYYHRVKVVRASTTVVHAFGPASPEDWGQVDAFIRKALKWPATVRIEVEEDTQLYAYASDKRNYPRAVFLKDGRAYNYHGHGATAAWLHQGAFHTFTIA